MNNIFKLKFKDFLSNEFILINFEENDAHQVSVTSQKDRLVLSVQLFYYWRSIPRLTFTEVIQSTI